MNYNYVIGVDISKSKLDLCLLMPDGSIELLICKNTTTEIYNALKALIKHCESATKDVLICAEYTGHYGRNLVEVSIGKKLNLWMENPAQIKLAQGVQRGKNDKIDATRIAVYARRYMDKVQLLEAEDETIEKLSYLSSERDLLVVNRGKLNAQLKDQKHFSLKDSYRNKRRRYTKIIKNLTNAIEEIEQEIHDLISMSEHLSRQMKILKSVEGIGNQVALNTIIATKGFTKFKDARKFACHVGCAPFRYTSGSSIRSKSKVSHRANKKLKQLYHMAALAVIRGKGKLKEYFDRKVSEGKNKMTVINAIRSKLISIVYCLIKEDREYEKNYIHSLV